MPAGSPKFTFDEWLTIVQTYNASKRLSDRQVREDLRLRDRRSARSLRLRLSRALRDPLFRQAVNAGLDGDPRAVERRTPTRHTPELRAARKGSAGERATKRPKTPAVPAPPISEWYAPYME